MLLVDSENNLNSQNAAIKQLTFKWHQVISFKPANCLRLNKAAKKKSLHDFILTGIQHFSDGFRKFGFYHRLIGKCLDADC